MPPWRRKVGLLRQDPALFPHLTVRQNLAYAPGAAPRGGDGRARRPAGIASLLDDRPVRLSGGQAHRVALGRLLISHCDALLLDEPYTGLDASLRRALTALVRELVAARQVPSVLVAHELSAAQAFADRLAVLDRGEVLQVGTPAEVVPGRPSGGWRNWSATKARPAQPGWRTASGGRGAPGAGGGRRPPGRGLVLGGPVRSCHPSGAGWEVEIEARGR